MKALDSLEGNPAVNVVTPIGLFLKSHLDSVWSSLLSASPLYGLSLKWVPAATWPDPMASHRMSDIPAACMSCTCTCMHVLCAGRVCARTTIHAKPQWLQLSLLTCWGKSFFNLSLFFRTLTNTNIHPHFFSLTYDYKYSPALASQECSSTAASHLYSSLHWWSDIFQPPGCAAKYQPT